MKRVEFIIDELVVLGKAFKVLAIIKYYLN